MMTIQTIDNKREVLRKSYAVWLGLGSAFAGLIDLAAQIVPGFLPFLPEHTGATVAVVLAALVPVGRVIKQHLDGAKNG